MLEQAKVWLKRHWWGLIIAHLLIIAAMYLFIWQFAEPFGIPDTIVELPIFAQSRLFFHLILSLISASYVTLALDLILRRSLEKDKAKVAQEIDAVKANVLFASEINQHRKPEDVKTKFAIGETIHIHMTWYGLSPYKQYRCSFEIHRDTKMLHQYQTDFVPSEPNWIVFRSYQSSANINTPGTHRVHIYLEGREKGVHTFYLYTPENTVKKANTKQSRLKN